MERQQGSGTYLNEKIEGRWIIILQRAGEVLRWAEDKSKHVLFQARDVRLEPCLMLETEDGSRLVGHVTALLLCFLQCCDLYIRRSTKH